MVERVGVALASMTTVTHCYERATAPAWPYNLYTMVHAVDDTHLRSWVDATATQLGMHDYVVLTTIEELKKTPAKYRFDEA